MHAIRTAAVLGAGTMGAQIAAHVANAGVPVLLLDVTRDAAAEGLKRARALKPDPFFSPTVHTLIHTGRLDTDLADAAKRDWIIEAVVERLDIKRALFEEVDRHRTPHTIVSSNTSGIPIAAMVEGRSESFQTHALGTHFFNPPRYLRLLEIIPTAKTDPAVLDSIAQFADRRLGKGIVRAKDTPNFIANRLGIFGVLQMLNVWARGELTIEEIDAITGPAIGRPKSATFRTLDLAGLDVVDLVVRNVEERLSTVEERRAFALPPLIKEIVARGWIGAKAGQGFYKKEASGEILTLDSASLTYRANQAPRLPSLDAARSIEDPAARIKTLFNGQDPVGRFLRETLGSTLVYTARVTPEIADSIDDVDRAMRWGFGWELGPFETWDAIGVARVIEAKGTEEPPALAREALERGAFRSSANGKLRLVPPADADLQMLRTAKERTPVVTRNSAASLIDLGDGVLAVEFHSKMNAIGGDTIQMIHAGVKEASTNFRALVVGNDAPNFSAGANLMLLLLEAQDANWDEVDLMVRTFQSATMTLKYADVPVVIATAGLALGGACEIALHGDRVQAAAETYIGLVEVGVGLIPAGGGTKEMLARASEHAPRGADLLPFAQRTFETIGFGKVSTSAVDARALGYLRAIDGITMNRERLMADAKREAIARSADYVRPQPRAAIPVGGETVEAALKLGVHLAWRGGRISDHDRVIGHALAHVIAGGTRSHAGTIAEQELLDLEREAFLMLCGQPKTLERIAYTLKTGKTLRN
jgi:3-hydroxyacyl-CoA dehydrogenase